ncbi:MAG: hypothetical protein R3Y07_01760 [Eubacteriales bacterium]
MEESNLISLEYRVSTLEEDRNRNHDSHREIYARLQSTEQSQAVSQERHEQIITRFDTITKKLEEISSLPSKRWNGLIDKMLYAVVGILVAFLLGRLGLT